MSLLTIYANNQPEHGESYRDFSSIEQQLKAIGVQFERWQADCNLTPDASQDDILAAYQEPIERLKTQYGFKSVDIINLNADHPEKTTLRQKFLAEHIHSDFEVRFFIDGCGLFSLHVGDKVYAVLCEKGDLISVPANTKHWFDMGENPSFKCIRLFTTTEGWVADFTDNDIAKAFPTLDQTVAALP
ncbi:1,2-dihydroxy-3-keto-5-methylthiopentene dioxygenase [Crenothrix sp.]|uniref:1,2-dihydroxy-3-keto-5-methylthiopentene dioxygenase n=1 Tax=Crenothrix sp. TaxID=3100433 RepID=UPI00374D99FB